MSHEWAVRVRTDSGQGLTATARNHSWRVGAPISFAPTDDSPSALELALGALAADLLGSLRKVCKERRIRFDDAEFSARCRLENPLAYIPVVGEVGTPAISEIEGVAYVSSFDEAAMREAWDEALKRSPLYLTLRKAVRIDLRLNVTA